MGGRRTWGGERGASPGKERGRGRSPSAPRRQRQRGCSPSRARRPRCAAPWAHGRLAQSGSEKEPPSPWLPGPGSTREVWLPRARVGFRFPAIINSFVFVNRRWGHIPGSGLIVPSLPLSLCAGRWGWGWRPPGLGGGGVQIPKVRKRKHFLSLGRVSTSDSKKKKKKHTHTKKTSKVDLQKAPAISTPRSRDFLAQPFPALLLLLLLFAPGLTFLRGVFGSKNPLLSAPAPLRPEKYWQTPIISRKVRKSIHGALCKITPAAACPAFIPNLFQESFGGRVWRGRERKEYGK